MFFAQPGDQPLRQDFAPKEVIGIGLLESAQALVRVLKDLLRFDDGIFCGDGLA